MTNAETRNRSDLGHQELQVIADSVLDIPNDDSFYMESDRHSDILLAPLLRLR